MNPSQIAMTKPTVHVLCSPDVPERALWQLLYGLEEEGIPCETWTKTEGDALTLAWEGAQASRLEVGVGMDRQEAVLHISKLEFEHPLCRTGTYPGSQCSAACEEAAAKIFGREVRE